MMFKKLPILALLLLSMSLSAQVEGVKYILEQNCETAQYDVKLLITSGSATTIPHRAQFNSQISIVVPTGMEPVVVERYNPIQNNQAYDGTEPMFWDFAGYVVNPGELSGYDIHSIIPTLSPAAFYNDMNQGDEVILLSFTVGDSEGFDDEVRLFDNENDPNDLNGSDFSNGFTIGGASQKYTGNIHESCVTSTSEALFDGFVVYPNPVTSIVSVDLPNGTESVSIVNAQGQEVYILNANVVPDHIEIDMNDFPSGVYHLLLKIGDRATTARIVKK